MGTLCPYMVINDLMKGWQAVDSPISHHLLITPPLILHDACCAVGIRAHAVITYSVICCAVGIRAHAVITYLVICCAVGIRAHAVITYSVTCCAVGIRAHAVITYLVIMETREENGE